MIRELLDHIVKGAPERVKVCALDLPGPGGASHHYEVVVYPGGPFARPLVTEINFQRGAIGTAGEEPGPTNEALLAIVIDRLRGFQGELEGKTGVPAPYKTRENALALTKLEEGLMWLQKRTRDRLARGVEGQHKA